MANPDFARVGPHGLPRVARALKGWRKATPQQPRWPMPEEGAALIAGRLEESKKEKGLWVLTGFSAYLRPSENSRLRIGDVIAPVSRSSKAMRHWTLFLSPFEQEILTKTKGFDEAIALDDTRMPWLGPALGKHAARRCKHFMQKGMSKADADKQPLWGFGQAEAYKEFHHAAEQVGLGWLAPTSYVLRHGGVSRDIALKLRSLEEAQRRGRWATLTSIKHYEKHGRLQWLLNKIGAAAVARGHDCLRRFHTQLRDF
ncbi:unnamed protein product [Polarella glacialis]|uniref:Uncharacterized protein n=1 Tax=Polarella glacialis TaxID=89957 RepID=A0A813E0Y9_POLGL|nr:unnamed protein product [Polarella glacialis]